VHVFETDSSTKALLLPVLTRADDSHIASLVTEETYARQFLPSEPVWKKPAETEPTTTPPPVASPAASTPAITQKKSSAAESKTTDDQIALPARAAGQTLLCVSAAVGG